MPIEGPLVLTTNQTAQGLQKNDIAYLNCDPESYVFNLDALHILGIVLMNEPSAIILYSKNMSYCTVNRNDLKVSIFTMLDASQASLLEDGIQKEPGGTPADGFIKSLKNNSGSNDNGGSGSTGRSPTTAVAMIILYSITGIITALFLLIIVVGAIRAHRHPERYGPRNTVGITRQSRAKGIARAMLETLPIVKFGDQEPPKPVQGAGSLPTAQQRDIELGATNTEHTSPESPSQPPRASVDQSSSDHTASEPASDAMRPEIVKTVSAPASPPIVDPISSSPEANAENGLACSVCTDDFVNGQDIRVLPCNHKFHPECIDPWLLNVSGTCPLCRVDLRPTTSHAEDVERDEHGEVDSQATAGATDPTPGLEPPPSIATNAERRGSRQRFSAYVPHILNRHRMRDATPEERIAALRRHRSARQEQQNGTDPATEPPRNRLTTRWSRAFGTGENSRRGSHAG